MSAMTSKKYIEDSDPHSFIELLQELIEHSWIVMDITITPGDGYNVYKANLELVEMG